jgi:DNA-binding MarR family transcriptional regulator
MSSTEEPSEEVLALERIIVASVAITARALSDVVPELTLAQWRVLVLIDRPGGLTVGAVASALEAKIAGVSRLIGRLRARGLIETRRDQTDARQVCVSLTRSGSEVRAKVIARRRAELLAALEQAQLATNATDTIERLAVVLEAVA